MRKIFIVLFFFILSTTSVKSNNHEIKREGFLSKDFKITKLSTIENAENKIILINNNGQNNASLEPMSYEGDHSHLSNSSNLIFNDISGAVASNETHDNNVVKIDGIDTTSDDDNFKRSHHISSTVNGYDSIADLNTSNSNKKDKPMQTLHNEKISYDSHSGDASNNASLCSEHSLLLQKYPTEAKVYNQLYKSQNNTDNSILPDRNYILKTRDSIHDHGSSKFINSIRNFHNKCRFSQIKEMVEQKKHSTI